MQVNQIVVAAAPGDAVTNSALEYRELLRRIGPSEIFAQYIDPALAGEIHQLAAYHQLDRGRRRPTDDLIIFHGSIGAPEVFSFVMARPERLVLVYHNVSPAPMYHEYDPAQAGLLETGRRDIGRLAGKVLMALAPSAYNAFELVTMGYRDVRISPLVVDLEKLHSLEPDPRTVAELAEHQGPVLLYVGTLLPHKSPERLVKAFHVLSTYLQPEAELHLVGTTSRSIPYRRRFDTFVRDLNLRGLHIVGSVTDEQLAAYYRRADVFVTASSHEGFCVPPVEAMGFGVPVVARGCGAIPETLDGAGIVVPPEEGSLLFAEAVERALTDDDLRHELVTRGRKRLDAFDPEEARAGFLRHILSVA